MKVTEKEIMWVSQEHHNRYRMLLNQVKDVNPGWRSALYIISFDEQLYQASLPALHFSEGEVAAGNIEISDESYAFLITAALSFLTDLYPIRMTDLRRLNSVTYSILENAMRIYYYQICQ